MRGGVNLLGHGHCELSPSTQPTQIVRVPLMQILQLQHVVKHMTIEACEIPPLLQHSFDFHERGLFTSLSETPSRPVRKFLAQRPVRDRPYPVPRRSYSAHDMSNIRRIQPILSVRSAAFSAISKNGQSEVLRQFVVQHERNDLPESSSLDLRCPAEIGHRFDEHQRGHQAADREAVARLRRRCPSACLCRDPSP